MNTNTNVNENILKAIEGLLLKAKDKGATESEAIQAGKMAQKLMAKYKVSTVNFKKQDEIINNDIIIGNRHWKYMLMAVVAKNFCCKCYLKKKFDENSFKLVQTANFYGRKTDTQIAINVFNFLHDAISKGVTRARKEAFILYGSNAGIEKAYAMGFIEGVEQELQSNCRALALTIPQDVISGFKNQLTKPAVMRVKNTIDLTRQAEAYSNGLSDGKEISKKRELQYSI